MMTDCLIISDLHKRFQQGPKTLEILDGVSLSVKAGEIVGLVGASGAGKSTLLQTAGLLDTPSSGQIEIAGISVAGLGESERTAVRREHLGFVYQFHHLMPDFTALENVAIAAQIGGVSRAEAADKARSVLAEMGLADRYDHIPAQLSGGEQQRVAIARALVHRPALLLADEPTGNLDDETSDRVFGVLLAMVRERGIGALIATHDQNLAAKMDRVLRISAGQISPLTLA